MVTFSEKSLLKLVIALAIYLTSLFASNTLGLKIMPFAFDMHLTVSVLFFPVVFLGTDIVGEIYGKRVARLFVIAGFFSTALFIGYSLLSLWAPWSVDGLWAKEGYEAMFGISTRMAIASLVAFFVAEYQDVVLFFFLKNRIGKKHFWLRSLVSNLWSQLLDSVLFMAIAFLGVYEWNVLISSTITLWLFKVIIGALYTPFSYIGLFLLRDDNADTGDTDTTRT